jgi:hypothetical protein
MDLRNSPFINSTHIGQGEEKKLYMDKYLERYTQVGVWYWEG